MHCLNDILEETGIYGNNLGTCHFEVMDEFETCRKRIHATNTVNLLRSSVQCIRNVPETTSSPENGVSKRGPINRIVRIDADNISLSQPMLSLQDGSISSGILAKSTVGKLMTRIIVVCQNHRIWRSIVWVTFDKKLRYALMDRHIGHRVGRLVDDGAGHDWKLALKNWYDF